MDKKQLALVLFLVGAITATAVKFEPKPKGRPDNTICRTPLHWYLDFSDERFPFSRADFAYAARQAAMRWNQVAAQPLLQETDGEGMPVSLVFDHRQQQAYIRQEAENHRGIILAESSSRKTALHNEWQAIEVLNTEIETMKRQVNESKLQLQQTFDRLSKSPQRSRRAIDEYESRRAQHNKLIAQVNDYIGYAAQRIEQYNRQAKDVNRSHLSFITEINEVSEWERQEIARLGSANKPQSSGTYSAQWSSYGRTVLSVTEAVTVYEAMNIHSLISILAHEFGHAIGIEHIPNDGAVMAPHFNDSMGFRGLSHHDLTALSKTCTNVQIRQ